MSTTRDITAVEQQLSSTGKTTLNAKLKLPDIYAKRSTILSGQHESKRSSIVLQQTPQQTEENEINTIEAETIVVEKKESKAPIVEKKES